MNEAYHHQSGEGCQSATNHLAGLHALLQTLKGALRYQLDGEDIDHRNASGIYANLSSSQEGVVEQEIDACHTKEHEQHECCGSHNSRCGDTHQR